MLKVNYKCNSPSSPCLGSCACFSKVTCSHSKVVVVSVKCCGSELRASWEVSSWECKSAVLYNSAKSLQPSKVPGQAQSDLSSSMSLILLLESSVTFKAELPLNHGSGNAGCNTLSVFLGISQCHYYYMHYYYMQYIF